MSLSTFFNYTEDPMYPIWFLDNTHLPIRLYRIDETNYSIIEQGNLTPIISNPSFVLINLVLLNFFQTHIQSGLLPKPVAIFDRASNVYINGYYSITAPPISVQSLPTLNHNGNKIWIDSDCGSLFISLALKKNLEKMMFSGLDCTPGYSMFGA